MTTETMTAEVKKMGASGDVMAERRGSAGFITLNRLKALNALSLQLVSDLPSALRA